MSTLIDLSTMDQTNINKIVGIGIYELRKAKNISQEKLANLAEIDRTYLPGIEKGSRKVSVFVLKKITDALEIKLSEFFKQIKI